MFDELKKGTKEKINPILKNKKLQIALTIISLFIIIYFAASARIGDIQYLKDQTSGKWIPLDLDSYYFLRISETMDANGGKLPIVDTMRYYPLNLGWAPEYLPRAVYNLHKIISIFDSTATMAYANIWYPIVFFVGSLLLFFILVYMITKSKLLSILGVLLFSVIPPYVYHTLLGSTDHESLGIFAFLLMMTSFVAAIRLLEKKDEEIKWLHFFGYIIWFAFTASFVIACWNGIAIYMFMIIPMTYFGIWIVKTQDLDKKKLKLALFYLIGLPLIFLFVSIWGDFSMFTELKRYLFEPQGLMGPFTYGYILLDLLLIKYFNKNKGNEKIFKLARFRVMIGILIIAILGLLFLQFGLNKNAYDVLEVIAGRMLNPFGRTRIGLTVSENQQPFFGTWIASFGKTAFWIAFLGIFFIGIKMAKGLSRNDDKKSREKEDKIIFVAAWIILVCGILFTRYSSAGLFNGENLISITTFFFGFALFISVCFGFYISSKIQIKNEIILIASWIVIMLISGRGAARLFIIISPLFVLISILLIKELYEYTKKFKEEVMIVLTWVTIIILVGAMLFNSYQNYNGVKAQAASIGPAANYQWQNAMNWVRTNTDETDKFISWWDYSYWIQYLGMRATLTDGGHASGYYDWLIGRYLLTGNRPELALSFMKTVDSDYLLIDPTDIGKYTAFSSIGSNASGNDRLSWIPVMVKNDQWTQEGRNSTTYILQGGTILDEDIIYEENGSEYILPAQSAGIGGVRITISTEDNAIQQPFGIFVYNNQQKDLPIRYLYLEGQIIDFNTGIPAVLRMVPSGIQDTTGGLKIDKFGALVYISPRVARTLFANLYLMDDPNNLYPTIDIAHTEEDYVVSALKAQGMSIDGFFYFQGLRAPLRIYKVDYPENIIARPDYFIPTLPINEDIVLANETLLKEIDNLNVTK
jgi:asparagine N-glycosylation enzyme membrane subunit Stt3